VTTAKDAVKLHDLCIELPCYAMEIEISIDDEARFWSWFSAAYLASAVKTEDQDCTPPALTRLSRKVTSELPQAT